MNKVLAQALQLFLILGLTSAAVAQSESKVTVKPLDESPSNVLMIIDGKVCPVDSLYMVRGQVMVCLRDLEQIGFGSIQTNGAGEVEFRGKTSTLTFQKGKDIAKVNSLSVKLPIDTCVRGGRLLVPLAFVVKALGYDYDCMLRPVATITTSGEQQVHSNSIAGRVTYMGEGVLGVRVRAVDEQLRLIKNASAVTDSNGEYKISGLADGTYKAYVLIDDNPEYFNRTTESASVKKGQEVYLKPIALGRVLAAANPSPGAAVAPTGHSVEIAWTVCPGASSYSVMICKHGSNQPAFESTSTKPYIKVPVSKLKAGTVYTIQVDALDANGEFLGGTAGTGGKPWTFTVKQATQSQTQRAKQ